jgi:hypothetical protein
VFIVVYFVINSVQKLLDTPSCLFFRYSIEAGMHTEKMPDGLALIIPMLQERHAGNYTCTAKYANTEVLSKTVHIKTFGESSAENPFFKQQLKTLN